MKRLQKYWKMANGRSVLIKRMTDEHLKNALEMCVRLGENGSVAKHSCFGTDMVSDPCIDCMVKTPISRRFRSLAKEAQRRGIA